MRRAVVAERLSIPDALQELFGIRDCEQLRTLANTFVNNGIIPRERFKVSERARVFIRRSELPVLHNVIVLHAVFGDTKTVKDILSRDSSFRRRYAEVAKALFFQRNSLMGVALQNEATTALVDALRGDFDLRRRPLPNPFKILPQRALGDVGGLLQAVLAQAGSLSAGDCALMSYLQHDLEAAVQQFKVIDDPPEGLALLRARILKEYREAQEFDDLLDGIRRL